MDLVQGASEQGPALGRRVTVFEGFDTIPAPAGVSLVVLRSDEVTALCPATGQPDQYTVEVRYEPRGRCLESKSAKLYFQSFRNEGIFAEALAARMAGEIGDALEPASLTVVLVQKARGGVELTARAEWRTAE